MPGPLPKNPAIRQRRNKASTRAVMVGGQAPLAEYPALPARAEPWHPLAARWWDDVWTSPMHAEFLRADFGALFRLVNLVDAYWKTGSLKVAVEIRLLEREFGLTPMSRRRLEWTVVQSEEAGKRTRGAPPAAKVIDQDPREVLDA